MSRIKGLVNCSVNFEVKKTAPLDARQVVDTVLELTETATWVGEDGQAWLYDGLVVAVKENNSLYVLKGFEADPLAYTDIDNWVRIDAAAAKVEVINNLASTDTDKPLAAAQGKILSDKISEVEGKLTGVYSYKGSKNTYADLPSDAIEGDVWNVVAANGNIPAGTNYAWNGTEWDALGGSIDLSGYYTKEETDAAIAAVDISSQLTEVNTKIEANTSAINLLKGDAETTGSLANTLKVAKDYTDTQLTGYVEKVEGSSLIPNEKLQLIDTNAAGLATLQEAVEANTASLTKLKSDKDTEGSVLNIVNNSIVQALSWNEL